MFVFDPDYTFTWPVKVRHPSGAGDVVQEFTATFAMPEDEKALWAVPEVRTTEALIDDARARCARYWVSWSGIQIKDGGDLPFTEQNRDRLLRNRAVRMAVDAALAEALLGIREKN